MDIYIDMDGVVAKYDKAAYINEEKNEDGSFKKLKVGNHYFFNLKPDEKMCNIVKKLIDNNFNVKLLSSVHYKGDYFLEHSQDKIAWAKKYIDDKIEVICLPCIHEKSDFIAELDRIEKLRKSHILVDDFNKNLLCWNELGGTAIKYCNGLNDPNSFKGLTLTENMTEDNIIDLFKILKFQYK